MAAATGRGRREPTETKRTTGTPRPRTYVVGAGLLAHGSQPGVRLPRIAPSDMNERWLAAYSCGGSAGIKPASLLAPAPKNGPENHDNREFATDLPICQARYKDIFISSNRLERGQLGSAGLRLHWVCRAREHRALKLSHYACRHLDFSRRRSALDWPGCERLFRKETAGAEFCDRHDRSSPDHRWASGHPCTSAGAPAE